MRYFNPPEADKFARRTRHTEGGQAAEKQAKMGEIFWRVPQKRPIISCRRLWGSDELAIGAFFG